MTNISLDVVKVTIIIVTWNKRDDVLNLLDSLQSIASPNVTIVVIDNASSDGSVAAIRDRSLPVTLIENSENLGGTGGFNTGIRYALNNLYQDYIWLLDNDAEVKPDTLDKLVSVMEADGSVGIAGSCILDTIDRGLIVEAGGHIDERSATWKPHLRYKLHSLYIGSPAIDVDYVPACSALVRRELFDVIGIMDERYFLHWDDVDFGRTATKAGFRVVAVLDSMVHHGTEKGYSNTVLYFDVRNSLLFLAKHLSIGKRVLPMFRACLRSIMASKLFELSGEKMLSWYLRQAVENFSAGRFGSAPLIPDQLNSLSNKNTDFALCTAGAKSFVLFAVGCYADVVGAASVIRSSYPTVSITLAAPSDRLEVYKSCEAINDFISYDLARDGLWGSLNFVLNLLRLRFDCAVTAGTGFVVPFAFFVRRNIVISDGGRLVQESKISLGSFWKLPCAVVSGFFITLPIFLKCWMAGRKMSNSSRPDSGIARKTT
ncbi:MAG TPA: glycosyltransferase family 2 protein [Desulfuromonadales bacterium]|nr:glycosyltransferase family 2 protein [Desulfuromonadales bacterium]